MSIPVYIQIHNQIKNEIESGKWKIGERIPSERSLSLTFHVSRMTLRQAVQTLVEEGILERRVGSGTYVASSKVQEKMTGTTSFTEIMKSQGRIPSSKTISYYISEPSMSERENLRLESDQQIVRMERIRYADGQPISFETTTVPAKLIEKLNKDDITTSFYNALEKKGGYKIGGSNQTITATLASEKIANLLEIKRSSAILRLRQLTFLENGEPFEYVRTQYAGDRFEFYMEKN